MRAEDEGGRKRLEGEDVEVESLRCTRKEDAGR